ncbi:MAG: hypothetical protein KDD02_01925 [Phaeodactylibacter sp.]|nr:hypothetical protein [Phaeodactylibacter sp.]MCB9299146.1 hypothetical protein [Lewinellaceae bacterium]
MPWRKENVAEMLQQVEDIIAQALALEAQYRDKLDRVHPRFRESARNLVHYRALRSNDIRDLQIKLGYMGISRLAKAESHTMANLCITKAILQASLNNEPLHIRHEGFLSIPEGNRLIRSNAKALLGYRSKGRRTRIMVTLPSEAAEDYKMVRGLVAAGMNCARINCAHDGPEQWKKMVDHLRKASDKLKRKCRISMDLGGPKIRTGQIKPGPEVQKYRPEKDIRGRVVQPVEVWIGPHPHPGLELLHVPVNGSDLKKLQAGDKLYFNDARFKRREFIITEVGEEGCRAEVYRTAILESGMLLYTDRERKSTPIEVGNLPPVEGTIQLKKDDLLILQKATVLGEPAQYDKKGKLLKEAHISCTSEEVFEQVQPGDPILFDDGMIEGKIWEVRPDEVVVKIRHTKQGGARLRADKGINLPASKLTIRGLTAKDRKDLQFVAAYADVVNMSFVNSAEDVRDLIEELERLEATDRLGIILKVETQSGFNNLLEILLEGMRVHPVGVMIARGDLAIECGWDNIGRVQEEILSLCQSAHIPDIWATQVLENMAKRGIPSRAEITDAAMAQRAECVMLNKGDYILPAIHLLDTILKDMEPYQEKNAPMLPAMELAGGGRR